VNEFDINGGEVNGSGGGVLDLRPVIRVTVANPTGAATAPIAVSVSTTGTADAPISVGVISSELTTAWSVAVSLAVADVSARLTGGLRVRAEEDAARVAEFTLLPSAGVVDPLDWTSAAVTIDFIRALPTGNVPRRIFTGKVDLADYDPNTRQVRFQCTDDLQNVVAALTKPAIDAIVGGSLSRGAQGDIDEHWDYAQARLESVTGSLDCNAYAGPRVSLWDGLTTWKVFDDGDILDQSLAIELPRRKELVNQIEIAYEYRYHRLRERYASVGYSATILGTAAYARGYTFPKRQEIESALGALGWHVISTAFQQSYDYVKIGDPAGAPAGGEGDWWIVTGGGVSNMQARLAQRHAQPITEAYTLTVTAPDSLAANGLLAKPLRGALASEWNPAAWEADMDELPDASAGNVDHAPDATRAESDAAITALVKMARRTILASHRTARVRWSVPCLPEIDLDRAAEIDTSTVEATGKIAEFEHQIDIGAGSAITRIGIALSGVAAGGIAVSDPVAVPTAPDVDTEVGDDDWMSGLPDFDTHVGGMNTSNYNDNLMGYLCNAPPTLTAYNFTLAQSFSFENPYYDPATLNGAILNGYDFPVTGFRARMPGVAGSHRSATEIPVIQAYTLAIPEDSFTLSA
jgi:hypothetical protein